jgi:bisphosphoglycerate-independent phosphoglycerate mutase (AlkP superfamily)
MSEGLRPRKGETMTQYFDLSAVDIEAVAGLVRNEVPEATNAEIEAFIAADWPNADEHQDWLNSATSEQIASWVSAVLVNTHPSMVVSE